MKNGHRLLVLSATLISAIALAGCTEQEDNAATTVPPTAVMSEVIDSDVTIRIETALLGDETLKNLDITVVTRKGDVLLTGEVDSQSQIDYVDKLVMSIEGVHTLHDHLTIKTP